METNFTNTTNNTNTNAPKAAPAASTPVTTTSTPATASIPAATTAPATTAPSEELCGSENILDTIHLKNLVDDLSRLYSTSVCTKVAKDTKTASEKRLIEAIRANLDRYKG